MSEKNVYEDVRDCVSRKMQLLSVIRDARVMFLRYHALIVRDDSSIFCYFPFAKSRSDCVPNISIGLYAPSFHDVEKIYAELYIQIEFSRSFQFRLKHRKHVRQIAKMVN